MMKIREGLRTPPVPGLAQTSISDYLATLAAKESTPGGGTVAAISAAQAAALVQMVARFTDAAQLEDNQLIDRAEQAVTRFLLLAEEDMHVFQAVMRAYQSQDDKKVQTALSRAAEAPMQVIAGCLALLEDLQLIARIGNKKLSTDTAIAADLLASAIRSSELNVLINRRQIKSATVKHQLQQGLLTVGPALKQLAGVTAQIKQSLVRE